MHEFLYLREKFNAQAIIGIACACIYGNLNYDYLHVKSRMNSRSANGVEWPMLNKLTRLCSPFARDRKKL